MKFMKTFHTSFHRLSKKRLTGYVLAAICVASTAYAATEHWNDASLTPKAVVATQAGDENWAQWKESWETIKADRENVSMSPGADATKMNFGWYSKDKAKEAEVRVSTDQEMKNAKTFKGTNTEGVTVEGTT